MKDDKSRPATLRQKERIAQLSHGNISGEGMTVHEAGVAIGEIIDQARKDSAKFLAAVESRKQEYGNAVGALHANLERWQPVIDFLNENPDICSMFGSEGEISPVIVLRCLRHLKNILLLMSENLGPSPLRDAYKAWWANEMIKGEFGECCPVKFSPSEEIGENED